MKTFVFTLVILLITVLAFAQENRVSISGGYAFANIEEADANGTGFRINGLYEFNPLGTKFAHGISFGYVGLSADATAGSYDVSSWPVYYAPRYMFGSEKLQGFIKGALGWQFSKVKRSANFSDLESNDSGFALGGGAGMLYNINEKVFLDLGYEFLWLQNSYYREGYLNTANLGIGIKF